MSLNGGVLANAIVSQNTAIGVLGSATPAVAETEMGEIDGGVLNGTIEVNDGGYAALDLEGNWVNNGTITVNNSSLTLGDDWNVASNDPNAGSDAWVNNGTIVTNNCTVDLGGYLTYDPSVNNLAKLNLGSDTVYLSGTVNNTGRTLTFTPTVTSSAGSWYLSGGRIDGGTIAGSALLANGGSTLDGVTNVGGGTLDGVTNNGAIDISSIYPVTFQGAWANTGTISIAKGAVVNLGGTFISDAFDNFDVAAGATVNLTGTLDNSKDDNPLSEGILVLGDSTGPLLLDGGTISQGSITTDGTNDLVATLQGGTLDGVTLNGTLDMTQYPGKFTTEKFSAPTRPYSTG